MRYDKMVIAQFSVSLYTMLTLFLFQRIKFTFKVTSYLYHVWLIAENTVLTIACQTCLLRHVLRNEFYGTQLTNLENRPPSLLGSINIFISKRCRLQYIRADYSSSYDKT